MIVTLFGGATFIRKIMPVQEFESKFKFKQINLILNKIKNADGNNVVIIWTGTRVKQRFFKMFHTTEPSCNTDDMLLLFDYVHLIKIFQNNWITEGYQEQVFHAGVGNNTAKCVDIKAFYNLDANQIVKLSRLTEVSV